MRKTEASYKRVVDTLKQGWAPLAQNNKSFTEMWEKGELTTEAAERFTGLMHSIIMAPSIAAAQSQAFLGTKHLIDIGGGSGAFCMAFAVNYPGMHATVMDLPQVCEVAKKNVEKLGLLEKVSFFPCNFFRDSWPTDGDAFLVSNILHDWPLPQCKEILQKAYEALPVGGRMFVHEILLDEGKTSPKMAVVFDFLMYMNHRSQQFTFNELQKLLTEVGFKNPKIVNQFGYYSLVVAEK